MGGLGVPLIFNLQPAEKKIQQIQLVVDQLDALDGPEKKGLLEFEALPMWAVQVMIFCWSYNNVRIVASPFWWDQEPALPIVMVFVMALSIPGIGFLVAEVMSRMSLWIARGDTIL